MTQQKERWIAHNQNCMPKRLKPDTLVNVASYEVGFTTKPRPAGWWNECWMSGQPYCIIGYQIVEQVK